MLCEIIACPGNDDTCVRTRKITGARILSVCFELAATDACLAKYFLEVEGNT
jgi:hypothetical protein